MRASIGGFDRCSDSRIVTLQRKEAYLGHNRHGQLPEAQILMAAARFKSHRRLPKQSNRSKSRSRSNDLKPLLCTPTRSDKIPKIVDARPLQMQAAQQRENRGSVPNGARIFRPHDLLPVGGVLAEPRRRHPHGRDGDLEPVVREAQGHVRQIRAVQEALDPVRARHRYGNPRGSAAAAAASAPRPEGAEGPRPQRHPEPRRSRGRNPVDFPRVKESVHRIGRIDAPFPVRRRRRNRSDDGEEEEVYEEGPPLRLILNDTVFGIIAIDLNTYLFGRK